MNQLNSIVHFLSFLNQSYEPDKNQSCQKSSGNATKSIHRNSKSILERKNGLEEKTSMKRVERVDTSLAAGSARSGLQKYHPRLLDSPSRRKSILKKESISHDFDCSSTVHYSTISPGVALRFHNKNHGGPNYPTDRIDENTTNGSDHSRVMSSSRTSKSTVWEPLSPTVRLYHRNKVRNSSLGAAGVDKPPIYNIESDLNVKRIYNRRPSSNKEESNSSLVRVDEGMMGKSKPERHSSSESFKSSWYSSNLSNLREEPQLQSSISLRTERC